MASESSPLQRTTEPADLLAANPRWALRFTMVFIAIAVIWRFVRYGLDFPVWGDEAALMLNVATRHSFYELLRPLENFQVAPLGFLTAEFLAIRAAGTSEYVLRLYPLITGIAAVFCFARLAWVALPPVSAVFSTGILLSTHYVTRYSLDLKPYGTDLLVSSLLLLLAAEAIRNPSKTTRMLLLMAAAVPVCMFFSFPAVFVAAAVSVALCPPFPGVGRASGHHARQRRAEARPTVIARKGAAYLLFNLVLLLSFLAMLWLSAAAQYRHTQAGMDRYWERGFPPHKPLRFLVWLIDVHTAEMMAYPYGAKNGGSALTLLLCIVGGYSLFKSGRRQLLLLLLGVCAATFAAAVLRRYPYGGSARIAQHIAPVICLLAGTGIARLGKFFSAAGRPRFTCVVCGLFCAFEIADMTRDVLHPYQTRDDLIVRQMLVNDWQLHRQPDSALYLANDLDRLADNIRWYLLQGVDWDRRKFVSGSINSDVIQSHREWWVLNCDPGLNHSAITAALTDSGYKLESDRIERLPKMPVDYLGNYVELQRWVARDR